MFTGIIESIGKVVEIANQGSNKTFWIESSLFSELKIDQSLSHNGVCLTIEDLKNGLHKVTAVQETLEKTNLGFWTVNSHINLERSLLPLSRLDGHFVQGHVDGIASCKKVKSLDGSWELEFEFDKKFAAFMIEKGSICVNGVSLTAFEVKKKSFKVAIIPYTWEHTTFNSIQKGDQLNLEFDIIGKYISRKLSLER
jgi:riboflavin synthase